MKIPNKAYVKWSGGNSGEYFLYTNKYNKYYVYDCMGNVNFEAGEVFARSVEVLYLVPTLSEVEEFQTRRLERIMERLEQYPCSMSCYVSQEGMSAARNMKENLIKILKEELL